MADTNSDLPALATKALVAAAVLAVMVLLVSDGRTTSALALLRETGVTTLIAGVITGSVPLLLPSFAITAFGVAAFFSIDEDSAVAAFWWFVAGVVLTFGGYFLTPRTLNPVDVVARTEVALQVIVLAAVAVSVLVFARRCVLQGVSWLLRRAGKPEPRRLASLVAIIDRLLAPKNSEEARPSTAEDGDHESEGEEDRQGIIHLEGASGGSASGKAPDAESRAYGRVVNRWFRIVLATLSLLVIALSSSGYELRVTADAVLRPWLPSEEISVEGASDPLVGYVLKADPAWVVVMQESDRTIRIVRTTRVTDRRPCRVGVDIGPPRWTLRTKPTPSTPEPQCKGT